MNEIIFVVEEAPEGGFNARALGASIFESVRDAVRCHFDESQAPKLIRLHFVRDELISA